MTEREVLAAVRMHCHQGLAELERESRNGLKDMRARYMVGYLAETLKSILEECSLASSVKMCQRCGINQTDGSGIMCTACWIATGEPVCPE